MFIAPKKHKDHYQLTEVVPDSWAKAMLAQVLMLGADVKQCGRDAINLREDKVIRADYTMTLRYDSFKPV